MSLFNAWYTKSSTFDEFEIAQNQTIDQSANGLRDNWITAVQLAFKSSFKDVGTMHHTPCTATVYPHLHCTLTGVSGCLSGPSGCLAQHLHAVNSSLARHMHGLQRREAYKKIASVV